MRFISQRGDVSCSGKFVKLNFMRTSSNNVVIIIFFKKLCRYGVNVNMLESM